jgi:hypothetical protein
MEHKANYEYSPMPDQERHQPQIMAVAAIGQTTPPHVNTYN